jgi:magnesium chelatase subunit I
MTTPYFPFSKIVGQDRLKEALLLNAINPAIGGVLIFGEKGTAKSTAVRGLKSLLESDGENSVPLVEMPLSATEEMVVGTIDIPKTLKTQETHVEYGLLHKAHNGILYIDEANLLEDHLVNAVLDSAAMGVNPDRAGRNQS